MTHILDHSVWAVRPETLSAVQRLVRADISQADAHRLLAAPREAEARVMRDVDADDLPRVGGVAILTLSGVIQPNTSLLSLLLFGGGGSLQQFRAELRAALEDDSVSAIVVQVDSPGGRTSLVEETAAELRAARDRKPIVAVANTMACSAAYYIASQATELAVTPSGYVGSIGVYMLHLDWSGFNEQVGVIPTYVFAAPYKIEGNEDEPLSDEARADWQREVDSIYDRFVGDVAVGRGVSPDTVRNDYGQGRVLNAQAALAAGMVDRVATFEETITALVERTTTTLSGTSAARAALVREIAAAVAEQSKATQTQLAPVGGTPVGGDPDPDSDADPETPGSGPGSAGDTDPDGASDGSDPESDDSENATPESDDESSSDAPAAVTAADDFDVLAA